MGTPRFRNQSEAAYAAYLRLAGLTFEYEQLWGSRRPDFTIRRSGTDAEPLAIADVKDLNLSDADEALLRAGHMVSIARNPAERTRRQIRKVWSQFEACSGYPCILVLAPGGDHLPDPLSVMAAMLGDYTLTIPVPTSDEQQVTLTRSFGDNGAMVNDQGDPMNTRISAVGLISTIHPGEVRADITVKTDELKDRFLSESTNEAAIERFLHAYNELRAQLTAAGYDLDAVATQVEYVLNPLAAHPFPKADFAKGYVRVWEYDLAARRFGVTHDWLTLDVPPRA